MKYALVALLCTSALIAHAQTTPQNSVDLLWQTDTYAPPFYEGKALYTPQSGITFVAIPHLFAKNGTPLADKDIVFTWKQDYVVKGSLSGKGKNSFSFDGNVLQKPTIVQVEVFAPSENVKADAGLSLQTQSPEAVIYEDDPLYGILYNKAVSSSYNLAASEVQFIAAPYYFSTDNLGTKNIQYNWTINNGNAQGSVDKNITLRHEGDATGNASVSLSIANVAQFFQKAQASLTINFGKL